MNLSSREFNALTNRKAKKKSPGKKKKVVQNFCSFCTKRLTGVKVTDMFLPHMEFCGGICIGKMRKEKNVKST